MFALTSGASYTPIDGEGIIVDTNTGRYVSLNSTASAMLQALVKSQSKEAVLDTLTTLMDLGDVGRETLERDLDGLSTQLRDLGLLEEV